MLQDGRILIVDDDQDILVAGKMLLKRHFSKIDICNRPEQIPALLAESRYDAILLDMNFGPGESSGEQGYRWLEKILAIDPQAVVIMITAHGDMEVAVEAMKRGATDFVAKPWHNNKVLATVSSAVKLSHSRTEASELRTANNLLAEVTSQSSQPIIAGSGAMRQALNLLERSAPTDANVLILGENGTGKELIARAIHGQSPRHHKVFMSVDLGAVAESLFESELFGHRKGAFTGANEDRTGRLLAADGGTLFLDEIGNLPLHLQAKLLTVLAQRQVTPLGSNQAKSFDVRVIAATNLPLEQLHDEQRFRQDLLFRLNTVEIHLPALRERQEDIAAIAEYYLKHYCRKYQKPAKQLSQEAMAQLQAYHWPGNIRELRHALERAVILSEHQTLDATDFQLSNRAMVPTVQSNMQTFNLEELERQAVEGALKTHRYNISHAAKALGLTRAALYRRMEKHGL
ncbi:sigma-54-dependent transcriptional regulator [Bowmanella yangjiangensis]|uniref:Sigma-54-dependent Fis family transcriptional regulator n=1 Tax=Bowmanella yangjiangensis TaxID=2811230 RepID=A0ABS3CNA3_9ALTE|nr:sigma-54 dependent transcriptional regulator [Bowmanella yangjiangensis]MBN7818537.1 sigma-54-dependent Fis family transcriptional regulator [Bowmanella yangjiangensis]